MPFSLIRRLFASADEERNDAADRPDLALVYRGPATLPGCPEAVAEVLEQAGYRVGYIGPRERRRLDAASLAGAALYAQPGGGDLDEAWSHLHRHADDIRGYVDGGGRYLGFCLGGYLAGDDPGFGLVPGHVDQYIRTKGACVTHESDAVVTLDWGGRPRQVYFQDGPYVDPPRRADAEIVARYDNGRVAALVCSRGRGRVALVGPHPEATADWFTDVGLSPPDRLATDLALDLVYRLTQEPIHA